jgi:hypothetical protein
MESGWKLISVPLLNNQNGIYAFGCLSAELNVVRLV